jgi:hypothetical protein
MDPASGTKERTGNGTPFSTKSKGSEIARAAFVCKNLPLTASGGTGPISPESIFVATN